MRWGAAVGAACVVLVVAVRAIDIRMGDASAYTAGSEESSARSALIAHERLLRETEWAQAMLTNLPRTRGLHVVVAAPHRDSVAEQLRAVAEHEFRLVGEVRARLMVLAVPSRIRENSELQWGRAESHVFFAGVDSLGAYCAAVLASPLITSDSLLHPFNMGRNRYNLLGPCAFWGAHGAPGPAIDAWLRNGAYRLAHSRPEVVPSGSRSRAVRRGLARPARILWVSPFAQACAAGRVSECERTVHTTAHQGPRSSVRDGRLIAHDGQLASWESHYEGRDQFMLAEVEREFGSERFARFWGSDRDVDAAFADAFGVPLGDWVHRWAQTRFAQVQNAGSALDMKTLLLSMITLLLLAGAGIVDAQRRQIR